MNATDDTLVLLRRWHGGDDAALGALVARDLPWLRAVVRQRMGVELAGRADADDIVQQALVNLLQYGPRFEVDDVTAYRGLIACIVENTIRKLIRDGRRQRRWAGGEEPLPSGSVVALSGGATRPSMSADRNERRAWIQLGLELLDPRDRELVLWRQWDGKSFAEIGAALDVSEDAARMRFERALQRLAQAVARLRSGRVKELLRV